MTRWPSFSSWRTRQRPWAFAVVVFVEPVGAELDVVALVVQHVPDDPDHGVRHSEDRFRLAFLAKTVAAEPAELDGEVRVLGSGRRPSRLTQRGT